MEDSKLGIGDIYTRWGKITEAEAIRIKSQEDLTVLVAKAYDLDKGKADAAVTAWMGGRSF